MKIKTDELIAFYKEKGAIIDEKNQVLHFEDYTIPFSKLGKGVTKCAKCGNLFWNDDCVLVECNLTRAVRWCTECATRYAEKVEIVRIEYKYVQKN